MEVQWSVNSEALKRVKLFFRMREAEVGVNDESVAYLL